MRGKKRRKETKNTVMNLAASIQFKDKRQEKEGRLERRNNSIGLVSEERQEAAARLCCRVESIWRNRQETLKLGNSILASKVDEYFRFIT